MNEKKEHPTVRIGKLYSKLSGQNHLIQVEHYIPDKTTKKNHGSVYFVIDINNPAKDSQNIIDGIIKTTIKYFYKNLDDPLASFEVTLRHVNETLATLAEEGNSEWITNLNCVIAVISGHDIHITQTGSAEGYLIRNKIISHITEGLSDKSDEKHPLNTFINISSGSMNMSDRIILSTEQLYNNLSLDRLRRLAVQHTPTTCIAEIARILAQENVRSIGTIVLEATTEEKLAKEVIRPQPEEVILQDRKHQGTKFSAFVTESQSYANKINNFFQQIWGKIKSNTKSNNKKNPKKPISPTNTTTSKRLPKQPPKSVNKPVVNPPRIKSGVSSNLLQKINQKSPNKNIIVIGIVILLIATLALSVSYLRNKQNISSKQAAVQTKLVSAESLTSEAENAVIVGDKTTARDKYQQALDILTEIESSPYYSEEIKALVTKINSKTDETSNITRFDTSKVLADLSTISDKSFSHLFKINENLFSFAGNIAGINIASGKITNITGFDIQNFVGGTVVDEGKSIAFYHNGQLQKFSPESNTLQDLTSLDSAWKPGVEIASYYNNLYILSPMENQVYKYSTLGGSDYSANSAYIDNAGSLDLSNAVSISIDGSVYLLKKDGSVFKFEQGTMSEYQLKNIPEPYSKLANPSQIYTEENLDYIFILDPGNKRIMQFKKETGEYIKQIVAENIDKFDSFSVNDKIKTIYLLADNKIYTANY
jgi:hypothetical protein